MENLFGYRGHVREQPAEGTYTFKMMGVKKNFEFLFSGDLGNWSLKSSYGLLLFTCGMGYTQYFFLLWRLLQLVVLIAGCPKVCVILISELVLLCQG